MNNKERTTENGDHPHVAPVLPEDVVLSVRGVSKKFCRNLRRSMWYGIQDLCGNLVGLRTDQVARSSPAHNEERRMNGEGRVQDSVAALPPLRRDEFWALQNISFDLKRGEVLGLIGVNGSGKTTLLRLIAGIFPPDRGEIAVRGRIGALIALGAGFHPHMTGLENIFLNAAILGLSRAGIAERLQPIIDFADIGPFIDAPVSTYSSGMRVKLGFAIAINVQADLLLIDEVLAVGDMGFRIKCLNAIRRLMNRTAVIFVSHSMQLVSQFCTRIAVMTRGEVVCDTPSNAEGIDCYLSQFPTEVTVAGTGGVRVSDVRLQTDDRLWNDGDEAVVRQGEQLDVTLCIEVVDARCRAAQLITHIMDQGLDPVIAMVASFQGESRVAVFPGFYRIRLALGTMDLNVGKYSLVISMEDADSRVRLVRVEGHGRFRVTSDVVHWGRIARRIEMSIERAEGIAASGQEDQEFSTQ